MGIDSGKRDKVQQEQEREQRWGIGGRSRSKSRSRDSGGYSDSSRGISRNEAGAELGAWDG